MRVSLSSCQFSKLCAINPPVQRTELMPQAYWIIPLEGGQIDNSLPGGRPPHIGGGPIYHPGHPDHGLPSQPGHPGNRPPGSWGGPVDPGWGGGGGHPSHPIHIPGVPDQGLPPGEEIPSNELPPPAVPPEHADDLIIGVAPIRTAKSGRSPPTTSRLESQRPAPANAPPSTVMQELTTTDPLVAERGRNGTKVVGRKVNAPRALIRTF